MGMHQQLSCEEVEVWFYRGRYTECINSSIKLLKSHRKTDLKLSQNEMSRCWSALIQSLYYDNRIVEFPSISQPLLGDLSALDLETFALWILYCIQDRQFECALQQLLLRWNNAIQTGRGEVETVPLSRLILEDVLIRGLGESRRAILFMQQYAYCLNKDFIQEMQQLMNSSQNNCDSSRLGQQSHSMLQQNGQSSPKCNSSDKNSLAYVGIFLGIQRNALKLSRKLTQIISKYMGTHGSWVWGCFGVIALFSIILIFSGKKAGLRKIAASFRDMALAMFTYAI